MLIKNIRLTIGVVILLIGCGSNFFAQDDSPVFVLSKAAALPRPKSTPVEPEKRDPEDVLNTKGIEVAFGKDFSEGIRAKLDKLPRCPGFNQDSPCYEVTPENMFAPENWSVQAFDLEDGSRTNVKVERVRVETINTIVTLFLEREVEIDKFKYVITYLKANIPNVTLGQLPKSAMKKTFTPAKGKADADIYFKGSAIASQKNRPIYSIEAKFNYLKSLGKAGSIGGKFGLVSEEASNADPDSITASVSYQKIFLFGATKGIKFNSDFFGGEFDRKNTTRSLMTGADATLFLPSIRFGKSLTFFTAEFMAGVDAGHNYKHSLDPNGLGGFWRPKVGINTYFLAKNTPIFSRVSLNTEYTLRLPRSAEPFTQKLNGTDVTTLTRRPRHFFGTVLNLLFTDAYGIAISYRYGSLPPAYKLVEHKVSIGFVVQLAQANK